MFNPSETETADLTSNLTDFSTKNVALMLPYSLSSIKNDSVSNEADIIKNNRVLRISLDFYSGVLMAVEKAKALGISTNLKVYDTQQQPTRVQNLIMAGDFSGTDVVIGPLLQSTSEEAASMLVSKNIPVISPMTNRELKPLPNLYQARPSDDMLREAMIEYIAQHSQDKNVVIVADAASGGIRNKLVSALPGAHIVGTANHNISEATLNQALTAGRENWVIVETESVALLSSTISALNRISRDKTITMFTTDKNHSYESDAISNEQLGNLKLHYPSEYREFDENRSDEFVDAFKEKYGVIPNKYAVRGYDLTLDVLLRLAAMGSLEKSVSENIVTQYVENKFLYRPKPNGGFYNDAVYIMHLNPDLSLSPSN
ncbi:MAG: ABC transporter substrate-binding protein [Gillisia sp.]